MPRGKPLSTAEIDRILELASIKTIKQISLIVGRPYITVNCILYKYGTSAVSDYGKPAITQAPKKNGRPRTWTPERLKELSESVESIGESEASKKYGITTKALRSKLIQYRSMLAIEQGFDPVAMRRTGRSRPSNSTHVSQEELKSIQRIASSNALISHGYPDRACLAKQLKSMGIKVAEKSKQITVDRDLVEQVYCLADEVVTYIEALVGSSGWNEQDCGVYTSAQDLLSISNTMLEESK